MKKILLVYVPFCTPASPPYSITNLYSFLKKNTPAEIEAIDLNLLFHKLKFQKYQKFFQKTDEWKDKGVFQEKVSINSRSSLEETSEEAERMLHPGHGRYVENTNRSVADANPSEASLGTHQKDSNNYNRYEMVSKEYKRITKEVYAKCNRAVVGGKNPELFSELLKEITNKEPDSVVFSIVYSSQAFYAYALIKELKNSGIKCIIGGPAVNEKLTEIADKTLGNELELLEFIQEKKIEEDKLNFDYALDFSICNLNEYFSPKAVIPIKTSSTCPYKKCAFCSHFSNAEYCEYPLETIKKTIIASKQEHFFLIDDMIPAKRMLEIAKTLKPLSIKWACQLKPTKEFDYKTLKELRESGLTMILWGVESGSGRILDLIKKGTNTKDIESALKNSRKAGILNIVYILFGFPTETKEEFMETIELLERNERSIDLVSTSVFGLQKGTIIHCNPENFGITSITEKERTVLSPKIEYKTTGLTKEEIKQLMDKNKSAIKKINKYPKTMNFFREHMFCLS